jgi:Bacterial inner membrane protein
MSVLLLIFGALGIACIIAIFQFNKRQTILRIQLLSGIFWVLHYIFLGAYTGATMNFLSVVRNYLFEHYRKSMYAFWFMLAAYTIAVMVTWHGVISLLPYTAMMIATIALWQKNPRTIRFMYLAVPLFWFTYNTIIHSYPGMIGDTITFVSLVTGIWRFDIKPFINRRFIKQPANS